MDPRARELAAVRLDADRHYQLFESACKRAASLETDVDELSRGAREGATKLAEQRQRIAELETALDDCLSWIHSIGNEEAWRGTMGDDGQGHDEAVCRASMMLERCRRALGSAFAQEVADE